VVSYGTIPGVDVLVDRSMVTWGTISVPLTVPVVGQHNRLNAAAAWAAAVTMGADPRRAAEGLSTFAGTGRRFELRGNALDVAVYDDYAHHPAEIEALIAATKEAVAGRLVVLFQPHLFSRTRLFAQEFAQALSIPDADVILCGVYGARELPEPGVGAATIGDRISPAEGGTFRVIDSLPEAAIEAARLAVPGGAVLTVGAGSVTEAANWILAELRKREAEGA
jgi:UDP-N-acetylmuramate--alanine ligase